MIERHDNGDVRLYTLSAPRLDAARTLAFKDAMRGALAEPPPGRVVMDLSSVEFLDSSGLGSLVAVMKMLPRGRRLELAGAGPAVLRVLQLTRMDRVFALHPSTEAALAAQEASA